MLTLPLEAGRDYRTREGRKASIFKTNNRTQLASDGVYSVCGVYECESDMGRVYDKYETWQSNGRYASTQDRRDIVDDWVDPVYKYLVLYMTGPSIFFDEFDEAVEAAGNATNDNPLIGYVRIDTAARTAKFALPGVEF